MPFTVSPVHGGLSAPVNRIVDSFPESPETLPKIAVLPVDQTTLYRIADGTLSPLEGPMTAQDYNTVLSDRNIVRDGNNYAWTIPIILPITQAEATTLQAGSKAALVEKNEEGIMGKVFGILEVADVYSWDKQAFLKVVYGTERTDHPGAKLWLSDDRIDLVGGKILLLPYAETRIFKDRIFNPVSLRQKIEDESFELSIAFQTRNPLHRAHEYALVYGAETLLRENPSKKVGVFLNPLVGQLKGDDVPADTRMKTYELLVDEKYLGQGDKDEELWTANKQDLNAQTVLAGLDMRMYYGGPSEAVMHAIYRQNLGLTHFIIGRKHADAPYADGTPIWGDFDAQTIFQNLGGDLKIKTVNVGFAAYFEEINKVGLVENNKGKTVVNISGTKMREILGAGEIPDARVMRESTAKILADYYTHKA